MKLVISHSTAADYWRKIFPINGIPQRRVSDFATNSVAATTRNIWKIAPSWVTPEFLTFDQGRLHALAFSRNGGLRSSNVHVHGFSQVLPPQSLCALGDQVYVCSPEFVFLQFAQELPLEQLVAYGCEICGLYAFDKTQPRGFRMRKRPLVAIDQLNKYVQSARGVRGFKKAAEALRYVVAYSASPMETACALLLSLPYRYGGYGLVKPSMNVKTPLPRNLQSLFKKSFCICDLLIPETNLVIEYLGLFDHADEDSVMSDRGRTIALREMGFDVIELTAKQVWNLEAFEVVAKRVAKVSNKRIRHDQFGPTRARLWLREAIRTWNAYSGHRLL